METVVCFHNPEEINGYLSNWYLADFSVDGIQYSSMEQYMMYQKALLFQDMEIAKQILNTSNVGKIKALGRSVKIMKISSGMVCGKLLSIKDYCKNFNKTRN